MIRKPEDLTKGLPELWAHQAVNYEVDGGVEDDQVTSYEVTQPLLRWSKVEDLHVEAFYDVWDSVARIVCKQYDLIVCVKPGDFKQAQYQPGHVADDEDQDNHGADLHHYVTWRSLDVIWNIYLY